MLPKNTNHELGSQKKMILSFFAEGLVLYLKKLSMRKGQTQDSRDLILVLELANKNNSI